MFKIRTQTLPRDEPYDLGALQLYTVQCSCTLVRWQLALVRAQGVSHRLQVGSASDGLRARLHIGMHPTL